jgi:HAD superfamily hydrolase (TIGR01450 family)
MPQPIDASSLLERYDVVFLDAYGVLVTAGGPLPAARSFLSSLRSRGKRMAIVSNDASRSAEAILARYRAYGLAFDPGELFTSGMLLERHFATTGLAGARTIVLGTADSAAFVERGGGLVVGPDASDVDVIVIADEAGFPFLPTVDRVLSALLNGLEAGRAPDLVVANPDLLYPKGSAEFGIAAGMIALLLERAVEVRFPGSSLQVRALGKPEPGLFDWAIDALAVTDRRSVVMIGDQLFTDVAGATRADIDSELVATGLTTIAATTETWPIHPTYVMTSLG